jgi:hypothetical protein
MLLPVLLLRLAGAAAGAAPAPPKEVPLPAAARLLLLPGTGIMIDPCCGMQFESMPSALAMLHTRLMPKLLTLPERHIMWLACTQGDRDRAVSEGSVERWQRLHTHLLD